MAKVFLTLALLCVFGAVMIEGLDNRVLQIFLSHLETCKAEVGADDASVLELMHNTSNFSMKAKCLFACILKKTKLMDDHGKFIKDTALNYVKNHAGGNAAAEELAEKIINICANIKVDDNPCEAAIQYGKCFKEQLDAHHIH